MKSILVNTATWAREDHPPVPNGYLIANAPRPLPGDIVWESKKFRHGIHYAAASEIIEGRLGWERLDARLIELITNEEIEVRVRAALAENGYSSLNEACVTLPEMAEDLQLPWVEPPSGIS